MKSKVITLIFSIAMLAAGVARASDFEDAEVARNGGNFKRAIEKYTLAIMDGDISALVKLSEMHEAKYGSESDYVKAYGLIYSAAIQGNVKSQLQLGQIFSKGFVYKKNCADGVRWFKLAASNGNAVAQQNLGFQYFEGTCVPPNYLYGYMWWSLSLAQEEDLFLRSALEKRTNKMSKEQVAEAQKLADKCFKSNYRKCD